MVSFFSPARVAFRVPSRIAHISSVNGIYGQRYPYRTVSPETSDSLNGTLSACHTTYISRRVRVSRRAEDVRAIRYRRARRGMRVATGRDERRAALEFLAGVGDRSSDSKPMRDGTIR